MKKSKEKTNPTMPIFSLQDRTDIPSSYIDEYNRFYEWVEELSKCDDLWCSKDKVKYWNVPIAFDIETTSWTQGEDRRATMYAFVIGVYGKVFVGRTWDTFKGMLNTLKAFLGLGAERKIIIWVHNLGYEFQFLSRMFRWSDVFAIDDRRPVRAETKDGIIFRCSYLLSGYSLAKVGDHLTAYPVEKMVGDLDYSLMRNSKTPLTAKEWRYIYHDGLVVMAYIQEEIEKYKYIHRLPLTKTGVVRRYMRNCCLYEKTSHKDVKSHKFGDYRQLMRQQTLTPLEYRMARQAFQGGFTHCNAIHMGKVIEDVQSMDFTSSYPSVMIAEKFPCSKGRMIHIEDWDEFMELDRKGFLMILSVHIYGLSSKEEGDHPISVADNLDRCIPSRTDNGRIVDADKVALVVTNIDLKVYKAFYDWDDIQFGGGYIYQKDYLPTDFVKGVISLYKDKTKLKGVEGKEREYMYAKENLNSTYGMCVTDICREKIRYDDVMGWERDEKDIDADIEKYNTQKNRFISYLWGVFITAYARRNLFTAIYELRDDYVYADTDSVKYRHPEKHKDYFERYNAEEIKKLEKACLRHGIPFEDVSPLTIKGKAKTMGLWDDDGHYSRFKTLGAKRYIAEYDDGHLLLTVAGVGKKSGLDFLKRKYGSNDRIFKAFSRDLEFPASYSYRDGEGKKMVGCATGKQFLVFIDEETEGTMTDYMGNVAEYHEMSSVYMENASYNLSILQEYIDFALGVQEVRNG